MRLLYVILRARGALDWFQVVKVGLWGPIIKIASFLSAFSIYKQTVARFVPTAEVTAVAIDLFERYIHPVPEFLFRAVGVNPSLQMNDTLALYLLLGGITTRFVKVTADGFYGHLQEIEFRSRTMGPPPGYAGNWDYEPGIPMSLIGRIYYGALRLSWHTAAKLSRRRIELGRGELANTIMTTLFSWMLYPIWPVSLIYIIRAGRSSPFQLRIATPHPKWENELWKKRVGRDNDKKVAYISQDMNAGSILLVQISFILICFLLIVTTNLVLLELL